MLLYGEDASGVNQIKVQFEQQRGRIKRAFTREEMDKIVAPAIIRA